MTRTTDSTDSLALQNLRKRIIGSSGPSTTDQQILWPPESSPANHLDQVTINNRLNRFSGPPESSPANHLDQWTTNNRLNRFSVFQNLRQRIIWIKWTITTDSTDSLALQNLRQRIIWIKWTINNRLNRFSGPPELRQRIIWIYRLSKEKSDDSGLKTVRLRQLLYSKDNNNQR